MSSLIFLVPISMLLLGVAIWAFVWAVRSGQFDDMETPGMEILAEEKRPDNGAESGAQAPPDGPEPGDEAARSAPAPERDHAD